MKQGIIKCGFIGAGNLAWNLAGALQKSSVKTEQVIAKTEKSALEFEKHFGIETKGTSLQGLKKDLDVVFICVPDGEILFVAETLKNQASPDTLFIHCSGSVSLEQLFPLGENTGVIYPLQTFTKGKQTDFRMIPLFVESTANSEKAVRKIASLLSGNIIELDSEGRRRLHLAAVFACNFPNLLWMITESLAKEINGLNFSIFETLVKENVNNVFTMGPVKAITGPAKRGDSETMKRHLEMLKGKPELQDLYELLSKLIGERG